MGHRIFINYRREDSPGTAHRLRTPLIREFGEANVFMDVDIPSGIDFVKYIGDQVAACDVFLAVIGSHWLDMKDKDGRSRLGNPNDFVSVEIEQALARDIRVIPVLVDGVRMPNEDDLPERLRPLVRRNAFDLRNIHLERDAEALIEAINRTGGARKAKPSHRRWATIGAAVLVLPLAAWAGMEAPRWLARPKAADACRMQGGAIGPAPATAAPGTAAAMTYGVQVSSHRTEADARCAYVALREKYPAILSAHEAAIRRADLGDKGVFYRVVVGRFDKPDQAVAFCETFKSSGGQCFIAEH
jgi:TIR domain/SPOR domain